MSGIFFYGIIETYGVTREQASWPVALAGTMSALAGPVVGVLCKHVSCRAVLLTSALLSGVTASVCYWAESVLFLSIVFGFMHGTTLCGLFVASNVLVAQHFEKLRTTACSFIFTASGLNATLLTPLVEFFRRTYGVRGAFLLYGAVLLNAIPAVVVLRSPSWLEFRNSLDKRVEHSNGKANEECALVESSIQGCAATVASDCECCTESQPSGRERAATLLNKNRALTVMKSVPAMSAVEKRAIPVKLRSTLRQFLRLSFLISALSFATMTFTAAVFVMIPADLAKDKGLDPSCAVYVLQGYSVGDTVFRALSGLAIDSRTLSLESVMVLGFVLQGLVFEWLVWAHTVPMMVAAATGLGVAFGSRIGLQAPVLVIEFGIRTLPMMMGGLAFSIGVSLLIRPPLIGYYRDNFGEYSGLLHLMAALNALCALIWTAKLVAKKRRQSNRRSKSAQDEELT